MTLPAPGTVVSSIRARVPAVAPFVVRATVPLPPGTTYTPDCPFVLRSGAGPELVTQWEEVARYPDGEIAVAEFLAVVPSTPLSPDMSLQLNLEIADVPRPAHRPRPADEVLELLSDDAAPLRIVCETWDGARYSAELRLDAAVGGDTQRFHRNGSVEATVEFSGDLSLDQAGEAPYGRRLFGFSAWVSIQTDSEVLQVELLMHNGFAEDPLPDVYFRELALELPSGWELSHRWPEPASGAPRAGATSTTVPLIEGGPRSHVMFQRQRREWRFAIHKPSNQAKADEILAGAGWGVCERLSGLWSWWNETTARYQPQALPLPSLDHLGSKGYARLPGKWKSTRAKLISGAPLNSTKGGRLGYMHPWGSPYGGVTGGDDIDQWTGTDLAEFGQPQGLLYFLVHHRTMTDRHHVGIYARGGQVLNVDNFLAPDGSTPWDLYDGKFNGGKDAPFRFSFAKGQAPPKPPSSERPLYEKEARNYDPIDWQHLIRRTGGSVTLAWLANDPIAIRELELHAALGRMGLYEGPKGDLEGWVADVRTKPAWGIELGRAHGWVTHTTAAAYAVTSNRRRARLLPWAESMAEVLLSGQMPNGLWQRNSWNKGAKGWPYNGNHAIAQAIEHGILANGLVGLAGSVLRSDGAIELEDIPTALVAAALEGVWRYSWGGRPGNATGSSPYRIFAVTPAAKGGAPYSSIPPKMAGPGYDNFQIGSTLAFGLRELAAGPERDELDDAVRAYCKGAADPLKWLRGRGFENLGNRAPLLAVLEG